MMVLITGANGFIGKSLCNRLTEDGFSLLRGTKVDIENTTHAFVYGDINGDTNWDTALVNCDFVIHLAAQAHSLSNDDPDPLTTLRTVNTDGTLNLARQAADKGVKRFLFISSIGVNGTESFEVPFTEKDNPDPHSLYAMSKFEAELGLLELAKQTSMEVVIIRSPLVCGPGAPGNFGSLIRWLSRGIPLPLGAVHNRRSLVGIDNLIDLIITCIDHPAAANQTFLVSDDEDLSTTELLRRMSNALGKPARLVPVPPSLLQLGAKILGKQDMAQRLLGNLQVDMSYTKKVLDWTPPVSVDEGLRRTAQWYLSQK